MCKLKCLNDMHTFMLPQPCFIELSSILSYFTFGERIFILRINKSAYTSKIPTDTSINQMLYLV